MNNASSVSNISDDEDGCFIISCLVYMVVSGFFVNGPYALITTAVSASLVSQVLSSWCKLCPVTPQHKD